MTLDIEVTKDDLAVTMKPDVVTVIQPRKVQLLVIMFMMAIDYFLWNLEVGEAFKTKFQPGTPP